MDVGAMTRMLHETIACERDIDAELEGLLAQRGALEAKLSGLERSTEVLELVRLDADQMLNNVRSTCQLAELVSGRVRELDLAQYRVNETVTRIEAIVDRTNCIVGAKSALENEDYESAAKCVETFLALEREFHDTEAVVGQPEAGQEQRRQLLESKAKLEGIIRSRFAAAAEAEDSPQVERFARLFAPLGLQEEGLRLLVAYLRRTVGLRARKQMDILLEAMDSSLRAGYAGLGPGSTFNGADSFSTGGPGAGGAGGSAGAPDFVDALTCLFREVALSVEGNEELLGSIQGEDAVVFAIRELQEECDSRAATIVRKYIDYKRLPKAVKDAAAATKAAAAAAGNVLAPVSVSVLDGSGGGHPGLNLREVEVCLEDMLLLSRRTEEYSAFMQGKLQAAENAGATLSPRALGAFKNGMFVRAIGELMGFYVDLEEYFMAENVAKAVRIDEVQPEAFTTSMVDDCFYILQNCARRAVSTGSMQPVLAIISAVGGVLNNEYRDALQRRLKEPNLATRLLAGATGGVGAAVGVGSQPGGGQKVGSDVAAALNNVDVSSEYTLKLRQEIEDLCNEVTTSLFFPVRERPL